MNNDSWLTIDPGLSGAMVHRDVNGQLTLVKMPPTMEAQAQVIRTFQGMDFCLRVVLENVGGSRPGNAAKAARTFAEHVGGLKMAIAIYRCPCELVAPQKWMRQLFGDALPKGSEPAQVAARKEHIYQWVLKEYAPLTFPKYMADAVGMMEWVEMNKVGKGG